MAYTTLQDLQHAPDAAASARALKGVNEATIAELQRAMNADPVIQAARARGTVEPKTIQQSPLYPAIVRILGTGKYQLTDRGQLSKVPGLGSQLWDAARFLGPVVGGAAALNALIPGTAASGAAAGGTAAGLGTAGGVLPSTTIGTGMLGPIAGGAGANITGAGGVLAGGAGAGISSLANAATTAGTGAGGGFWQALLKASPALVASIPALTQAIGGSGSPGGGADLLSDPQLRDLLLQSLQLQLGQQQRLDPLQEAATALAGRLLPDRLVDTSRITGAGYGARGTSMEPEDYLARLGTYSAGLR